MNKLTVKDVRDAIAYGHDCFVVENLSDNELMNADFLKDLHMGNIRVANLSTELQRRYNIYLPVEMFKEMEDNTVRSFLAVANEYMVNLSK